MTWNLVKSWLTAIPERNSVRDLLKPAPNPQNSQPKAEITSSVLETGEPTTPKDPRAKDPQRSHQRSRMWRRRALLRKGAHLYSTMPWTRNFVSLAMLDEDGAVIGWFERSRDPDTRERAKLPGHVSQLYANEDVMLGIPMRDLCTATIHGETVQTGWRLGIDGRKFWATSTIRAVLHRDGRLQGFSYLTYRVPTPWKIEGIPILGRLKWPSIRSRADADPASRSRQRANEQGGRRFSGGVAAFVALSFAVPAMATDTARAVPPNARASAYGSGWDCAHGYQRVRDACEQIVVPANAYLEASGSRWRCERGYLNANGSCALIKVPANAYLDDSLGTGWRCERRYREAKGACVPIKVPAHAHEVDSSYGSGWECDHGYALSSGSCQAVVVPSHAFLTRSGDEWKCDRGFIESDGGCLAIKVPKHGYLDMQGNGWQCDRGYAKTASDCQAIKVPANAHLDYTGDRWRCDRGFTGRGDACIQD